MSILFGKKSPDLPRVQPAQPTPVIGLDEEDAIKKRSRRRKGFRSAFLTGSLIGEADKQSVLG